MQVIVCPPDPKLKGWPLPVGNEQTDIPFWLKDNGFIMGSWLATARASGWTAVGFNCFRKRSLVKCK